MSRSQASQQSTDDSVELISIDVAEGIPEHQEGLSQAVAACLDWAQDQSYGHGILVGLLGVDIDSQHEALRGRVLRAPPDSTLAPTPSDAEIGLGTILASLVCGQQVEGPVGIAQRARVQAFPRAFKEDLDKTRSALQRAISNGLRILVVPVAQYQSSPLIKSLISGLPEHVIVIAPAGHDHLDQDAFPAELPAVLSVSQGDLKAGVRAGANLSPNTEIIAPWVNLVALPSQKYGLAEGQAVSLGLAAGVIAATLSLDKTLTRDSLRRVLKGAAGVCSNRGFYRRYRAIALNGRPIKALARSQRGQICLRNLAISPQIARPGDPVTITADIENIGRRRISGALQVALGDNHHSCEFQRLRVGEIRQLSCRINAPEQGTSDFKCGNLEATVCQVNIKPVGFAGADEWRHGVNLNLGISEAPWSWIYLRSVEKPFAGRWRIQYWNGGLERRSVPIRLFKDSELVWQHLINVWGTGQVHEVLPPIHSTNDSNRHTWRLEVQHGESLELRLI